MASFEPNKPFNSLPSLPPKADIETRAVLKQCIEARASIAALRQACALIPNPAVLINTLPLLEAQKSSEIENVVTTADELFRHAQFDDAADGPTKEALQYRTALRHGIESIAKRPLNTRTAEEVCSIIKGVHMTVRKIPGTTLTSKATGKVIYTPPVGEALLRGKLANWERFVHEQPQIDPLIRMAVAHYQFEAIHPFTDGNGRTGRILNQLMLVDAGLLDHPVLYLSRFIMRFREDYYRLLLEVTKNGNWEGWVNWMLIGVADTASWTSSKIDAIRKLMEDTSGQVRHDLPRIYSRELVDAVFVQPYCRIQNLVDSGLAKRETASKYLKELVRIGVLAEQKVGRERLFVNPALVKLLVGQEAPKRKANAELVHH